MSASTEGPLVLLVEDNADIRELYAAFLGSAGFRVTQAHDGFEALERVAVETPDVIVTDLAMPGMDGIDLCRRLRNQPATGKVPILAVSGHVFPSTASRATEAGCDEILRKPCLPDTLLATVQRLLEEHGAAGGHSAEPALS